MTTEPKIFHARIDLVLDHFGKTIKITSLHVKATVVLHNTLCPQGDIGTSNQKGESDLINYDLHDGISRPLKREGHQPQDNAQYVRDYV